VPTDEELMIARHTCALLLERTEETAVCSSSSEVDRGRASQPPAAAR